MKVNKTNKHYVPFTNIYLVKNDKVLLLHRNENKKIWPNKLLGIGGKIEPGEDLFDAAKREFFEETGVKPTGLKLKGTFSWDDETNYSGISYLFVASGYRGKINYHSDEGELSWFKISEFFSNPHLAEHQKLFFETLLSENFYASHSSFSGDFNTGDIIKYDDNIEYYKNRSKK